MAYDTPPLPYPYDALEPHYDARTVEIHHDRHHVAYTTKLNAALAEHPQIATRPIEDVLRRISDVPADIRQAVINHGGGHYHHTFFWEILAPDGGGAPRGAVADAITKTFGGFDAFRHKFTQAALARFGSGWAWLCVGPDGQLHICDTPNQDSPLSQGHSPLLTIDVWEHAYYLKYQNRRPDWIEAWWHIVNWDRVAELYDRARR